MARNKSEGTRIVLCEASHRNAGSQSALYCAPLVQEEESIRRRIYENICSTYLAAMVFVFMESIEVGRSVVVRMGKWSSFPWSLTWRRNREEIDPLLELL